MTSVRCPSCGGAVRADSPWCTLCWADLRPKPAPPPPPAPAPVVTAPADPLDALAALATAPAAVPDVAVHAAPVAVAVDPLTAPLAAVLGGPAAVPGVAAAPASPEAPAATWPCVECGAHNRLDLDACAVCTTPFGGRIARLEDVKGTRRRYMLMGLGAVGAFLLLLAIVTMATTTTVPEPTPGMDPAELEQPIDYSSLPQEE